MSAVISRTREGGGGVSSGVPPPSFNPIIARNEAG
jgi:hypothetical protein